MIAVLRLHPAAWYLLGVNLSALLLTVYDKSAARHHLRRVPEHMLLAAAAIGGSPAMLLTMLAIRHKTRHVKFMAGLPAILAAQICAALLFHLSV